MRSKRCSKCRETKPISGFHRDRARSDGLRAQCKKCIRAYNRAYYEERREARRAYYEAHLEERRAYQLAYREAHREEWRAYREAHLEERRAYNRAYRESRREELLAHGRAYWEAHREEFNAQGRKRKTEARKASREVATRNGEPWTPAEDKVVLTSEGTMLEIAIELGRTTDSVNNRRNLLRRKAVAA